MRPYDPAGEYTPEQVAAALTAEARTVGFRFERLDSANNVIEDLVGVTTASVANNNLAQIKRTAKFTIADATTLNYLSDRVKPYVRLAMPEVFVDTPTPVSPEVIDDFTTSTYGIPPNWVPDETAGTDVSSTWEGLYLSRDPEPLTVRLSVPGLTIGLSYTITMDVLNASSEAVDSFKVGVTGIGEATPIDPGYPTSTPLSYVFTATGTTHEVYLTMTGPTGSGPGYGTTVTDFLLAETVSGTWIVPAFIPDWAPIFGAGSMTIGSGVATLSVASAGMAVVGHVLPFNGLHGFSVKITSDNVTEGTVACWLVNAGFSAGVYIEVGSGMCVMQSLSGPPVGIVYDPVEMAYLRAWDDLAGTVHLDTSPDGITWTARGSSTGSVPDDAYIFCPIADDGTSGVTGTFEDLIGWDIVSIPEPDTSLPGFVEWPLGVFLLSTPGRTKVAGATIVRQVDAYDQLVVLRDDKVTNRYAIASGTAYTTAIAALLPAEMARNITTSALTLSATREWDPGTPKLTIINDLLNALNYSSAWFDEDGTFVAAPYTSPSDRASEWTYATDETSVISGDIVQTLDLFNVPNKWTVVVSDPDKSVLTSSYTNDSPSSPTSTVNRGRTITDFREERDAADQTTLDAKVARLAFEASQVYEVVEFLTSMMPIHSNTDVLTLDVPGLVSAKYSEHEWSMDLVVGGKMKHKIRRVVTVS